MYQTCESKVKDEIKISEHDLKTRKSQHILYINTKKLNQPTGKHFNQQGHSKANLQATVLKKSKGL